MTAKPSQIKVGRQGITVKGSRIPASFFRHQQPGKKFVVLDDGDRRLMNVRTRDLDALKKAYLEYLEIRKSRNRPAR